MPFGCADRTGCLDISSHTAARSKRKVGRGQSNTFHAQPLWIDDVAWAVGPPLYENQARRTSRAFFFALLAAHLSAASQLAEGVFDITKRTPWVPESCFADG